MLDSHIAHTGVHICTTRMHYECCNITEVSTFSTDRRLKTPWPATRVVVHCDVAISAAK